jgi:T5SS/PEP-CTERM-associated repeat protein
MKARRQAKAIRTTTRLAAAVAASVSLMAVTAAQATTILGGTLNCSTAGMLTTGNVTGQFIIGCTAPGSLSIDASPSGNGVTAVNGNHVGPTGTASVGGSIGNPTGGVGTVTVTGNGTPGSASLNMLRSLQVGFGGGTGTLTVQNGGLAQTTTDTYGITLGNSNSNGTANVIGAGSLLSSAGRLNVGAFSGSTGTLSVSAGGDVQTTSTTLANTELVIGNGTVTVNGAGSTISAGGIILGAGNIGETSSLSIQNGATVTSNQVAPGIGGGLSIGADVDATVTVTGAGSTLNVGPVTSGFLAGNEISVGGYAKGSLVIDQSGAVNATGANINVSGGALHTSTSSPGLLTVKNGGTLTADTVTVWANGTLNGNGTITADVVMNGGTIAPGTSPGTMTIFGDLTLLDGILALEIDPLGLSDFLVVNGDLSIGADFLFDLTFLNSPTLGDTFNILSFFDVSGSIALDPTFDLSQNLIIHGADANLINVVIEDRQPPTGVPEPATIALFGVGVAGFLALRRRRERMAASK